MPLVGGDEAAVAQDGRELVGEEAEGEGDGEGLRVVLGARRGDEGEEGVAGGGGHCREFTRRRLRKARGDWPVDHCYGGN